MACPTLPVARRCCRHGASCGTPREALPSSITDDEWTLVYAVEGEPVGLYHRRIDPEQRENVFAGHTAEAQRLHRGFVRFLEEAGTKEVFLAPGDA